MRILVDARMVGPLNMHGIARYTLNLIRGLSNLGHSIDILTHESGTRDIIGPKFIQNEISCKTKFSSIFEWLELTWNRPLKGYDIFHYPSFAVPLNPSANTVISLHDLTHLHPPFRPHFHLYYKTVIRQAAQRAGRIIALSEWTKKDLISRLGLAGEKIQVIPNGLEPHWFVPSTGPSPIDAPYFLCVSNPKPHKNVPTLLRACEHLWGEGLQFRLALCLGKTTAPPRKSLNQNILWLPHLSDQEIKRFYHHALALVSPSLLEGYNFPMAEALAQGTAVIASKTSANTEFHGKGLFFYESARDTTALASVLRPLLQQAKIESQGENILTVEEVARRTEAIYRQIQRSP